jgi:hypothetical protein
MEKIPACDRDNTCEKDNREPSKINPVKNGEDLRQSQDKDMDQDFPGKPHTPAGDPHTPAKEEIISNGSAGAFEATENTIDDAENDEDNDDFAIGHSTHY